MEKIRSSSLRSTITLLILSAVLYSCGGGGGGTAPAPPAPPPPPSAVSVTITPSVAYVLEGITPSFTFNATVSGSSNQGVTWSLQEGSAGGTIVSGVYTAPNTPGTYHLIATSVADSSKSATSIITVPHYSRFVFVGNKNDGTVSAYTINSATGQMRASGYVFVGSGANPGSITVDPSNQFVYVADSGLNSISAYSITSSGSLTNIGTPITTNVNSPTSIAMSPNGQALYVANSGSNSVSAFNIAGNGTLSSNSSVSSSTPNALTVDPFGKYLYLVDNALSGTVSAFKIGSGGGLTSIGTAPAGTNPSALAVDPTGRYVYVTDNTLSGKVSAFSIGSGGGLTPISAVSAGTNPTSVAVDPSGRYLYVSNFGDNTVSSYSINASTGALTLVGTPIPAGTNPGAIAIDPQDNFVYVANNGSNDVYVYKIQTDGSLLYVSLMRSRSGPNSIMMSQGMAPLTYVPTFLYTANNNSNNISAFSITPGSGLLTDVTGTPFTSGTNPSSITIDPSGRFLYASNFTSGNVWAYAIDPNSGLNPGSLNPVGSPVSSGAGPISIAADPSGRFVYTVCSDVNAKEVSFFNLVLDGSLTAVTPTGSIVTGGANPYSVAIDPTGQFAYVTNLNSGSISPFSIQNDGTLAPIGGSLVPAGTSPYFIAVDPTGQFAYVVDGSNGNILTYKISSLDGHLTSNTTTTQSSNPVPISIAIEPSGKYLYVANYGSGTVSLFDIASDGSLTWAAADSVNNTDSTVGTLPTSVTVDPSGQYVYVVNYTDNNVISYPIQSNGSLGVAHANGLFGGGLGPASVVTTGIIQ